MNEKTSALITIERILLVVLAATYLFVVAAFAIQTPDWQAPDEPAHYNYVAQVAEKGCCPVIEMGDWDLPLLGELTSTRFHPDKLDVLPQVQYEDHQPPLYYLLASPVYRLSNGDLIAVRLFSVVLGLITVLCSYAAMKTVYPARPYIALAGAAFIALLPQHVHIIASVNNDALAEAVIALTLWQTLRYLRGHRVPLWALGVLLGIGFITKTTTYYLAAIVPLAVVLHHWQSGKRDWRGLLRALAFLLIPALLIGVVWWLRNIGVYGFPDFLGLRRHDAVVVGQLRTADYINQVGLGTYVNQGIRTTLHSFIGQFGWMALPLDDVRILGISIYSFFYALFGFGISGLILGRFIPQPEGASSPPRPMLWVLGVMALLSFLAFGYYNTEFLQLQGRYLFPGLIPIGLGLSYGWAAWWRLLRRLPAIGRYAYSNLLPVGLALVLAFIDMWLLVNVIVPNLSYS
ncbi:MAG: DUF2142 domain-containing protein [Chloroflexi bacterium]|nr:MAG: DUF2142 domain-containing protein [Chloroflexota bacterium]